MQANVTRTERLRRILTARFQPEILDITDESARHAGHAGARSEGETHYRILMISSVFIGMSRVQRERAVHEVLSEEYQNGLHALSLSLAIPAENKAG